MRARVTKAFPGVEDGQVHPRPIEIGETISGDLAREAVAGGFAEPVDEAKEAAELAEADAAAKKQASVDRLAALKAVAQGARVDIAKAKTAEEIEAALKAAGVEIPA